MYLINKIANICVSDISKTEVLQAFKIAALLFLNVKSISDEVLDTYTKEEINCLLNFTIEYLNKNFDECFNSVIEYIVYLNELETNQDNIDDNRYKNFLSKIILFINSIVEYYNNKNFKTSFKPKHREYNLIENKSIVYKTDTMLDYNYSKINYGIMDIINLYKMIFSMNSIVSTLNKINNIKKFIHELAKKFNKQSDVTDFLFKYGKNNLVINRCYTRDKQLSISNIFNECDIYTSTILPNLETYSTTKNDPNGEYLTIFLFTLSTMYYSNDPIFKDLVIISINNFTPFYIIFTYMMNTNKAFKKFFTMTFTIQNVTRQYKV